MTAMTRTRWQVLLVAGIVIVGAGGLGYGTVSQTAAAQSQASVVVSTPDTVEVGSTVDGDVEFTDVGNPQGVGSFTIELTYNESAVDVDASENTTTGFDIETARPSSDTLRITGFTGAAPGPTGTGSLFDIQVTGDSASDADIGVTMRTFTDSEGDAIPVDGISDTITVSSSSGDGEDDSDGGGGGGGGASGGGAAPAPTQDVQGDAVADSSFDGRTLSTQVDSASAGSSVTSSLNDDTVNNNIRNTGASLNSLTTEFANDVSGANFETTYSATNPSDDVPDLQSETNADEIAYINVDTNVEETDIDSVTFEFSVSRDRLSESGLSPDEVALYRFNGGEYTEYDPSIDSEGDDRITYTVESPGLSVFAIGAASDQAADTATPEPGTATPEPDTGAPEPATDTPTDTQPTTATGTPGFGPIAAITALLGLAFVALRRRT